MTDRPTPSCRFCSAPLGRIFVDLGLSPLANRNLRPEEVSRERKYPLVVRLCDACLLVQADDSVPPGEIFSDYDYFSSFSPGFVAHARRYCEAMQSRFNLGPQAFVVEVASNDGYLLRHFVDMGVRTLGVEPAANVAEAARKVGVPTEVAFFGAETARALARKHGKADLTAANNVLAHAPDTRDFVAGFREILNPEGVSTFEFPHVMNLIDQVQFDTIYHEHFFYLSLVVSERLMASAGLRVFDVEEIPTHGGSLRLFVCHEGAGHAPTARLEALRRKEAEHRLDRIEGYEGFAARVARSKSSFLEFVSAAKAAGKTIAAYGAAAKGNTFLNFCGVGNESISAVYDMNPAKQGKLTPGTHVPILAPSTIGDLRPDYLVILPWNIADEVRQSMAHVTQWGCRFVTAIPETRIL
jgi:SAM-dependent methyltransferase